ncbi:MAG: hypothetical protein ABIG35_04185 [Pseudomonadota bacterium]
MTGFGLIQRFRILCFFPVDRGMPSLAANATNFGGLGILSGVLLQVSFVKILVKTSVGKMNKRLMRADPSVLCN